MKKFLVLLSAGLAFALSSCCATGNCGGGKCSKAKSECCGKCGGEKKKECCGKCGGAHTHAEK